MAKVSLKKLALQVEKLEDVENLDLTENEKVRVRKIAKRRLKGA